jgi:hypothetical protein
LPDVEIGNTAPDVEVTELDATELAVDDLIDDLTDDNAIDDGVTLEATDELDTGVEERIEEAAILDALELAALEPVPVINASTKPCNAGFAWKLASNNNGQSGSVGVFNQLSVSQTPQTVIPPRCAAGTALK